MQQQVKVVRTKLADALIGAVHSSINAGHNTGRLGRLVLTAEAQGVGIKQRIRLRKVEAGYSSLERKRFGMREKGAA
jgi:hypothetical protein